LEDCWGILWQNRAYPVSPGGYSDASKLGLTPQCGETAMARPFKLRDRNLFLISHRFHLFSFSPGWTERARTTSSNRFDPFQLFPRRATPSRRRGYSPGWNRV